MPETPPSRLSTAVPIRLPAAHRGPLRRFLERFAASVFDGEARFWGAPTPTR